MCGIIGVTGADDALPSSCSTASTASSTGATTRPAWPWSPPESLWRVRAAEGTHSVDDLPAAGRRRPGRRPDRDRPHPLGHPRAARPSSNAHPHLDCTGRLALVHNGIIENHAELAAELVARGHVLASETDTEVLAHLIEERHGRRGVGLAEALRAALVRVAGSFAIAVVHADEPDLIVAARRTTPLVVGLTDGRPCLASDIPALLGTDPPALRPRRRPAGRAAPGIDRGSPPRRRSRSSRRRSASTGTWRPPRRAATTTS